MTSWEHTVASSLTEAEANGESCLAVIKQALTGEGVPELFQAGLTRMMYSDLTEIARFQDWVEEARAELETTPKNNDLVDPISPGQILSQSPADFRTKASMDRLAGAEQLLSSYRSCAIQRFSNQSGITREEFYENLYRLRPSHAARPLVQTSGP